MKRDLEVSSQCSEFLVGRVGEERVDRLVLLAGGAQRALPGEGARDPREAAGELELLREPLGRCEVGEGGEVGVAGALEPGAGEHLGRDEQRRERVGDRGVAPVVEAVGAGAEDVLLVRRAPRARELVQPGLEAVAGEPPSSTRAVAGRRAQDARPRAQRVLDLARPRQARLGEPPVERLLPPRSGGQSRTLTAGPPMSASRSAGPLHRRSRHLGELHRIPARAEGALCRLARAPRTHPQRPPSGGDGGVERRHVGWHRDLPGARLRLRVGLDRDAGGEAESGGDVLGETETGGCVESGGSTGGGDAAPMAVRTRSAVSTPGRPQRRRPDQRRGGRRGAAAKQLPFTGFDPPLIAFAGAAALAAGALLRRRLDASTR